MTRVSAENPQFKGTILLLEDGRNHKFHLHWLMRSKKVANEIKTIRIVQSGRGGFPQVAAGGAGPWCMMVSTKYACLLLVFISVWVRHPRRDSSPVDSQWNWKGLFNFKLNSEKIRKRRSHDVCIHLQKKRKTAGDYDEIKPKVENKETKSRCF